MRFDKVVHKARRGGGLLCPVAWSALPRFSHTTLSIPGVARSVASASVTGWRGQGDGTELSRFGAMTTIGHWVNSGHGVDLGSP